MTDANEVCESLSSDQDELIGSDTDDTKEEHEGFSCHEEPASGDIPSSLLSYFESSKSRAAACEKFILEDLGDITASCLTEDGTPIELNKEMMKVNEQLFRLTENVNDTTDHHLLYDPGEMQTLYAHNGSMSPNNEGDAETDEYIEDQNYLTLKINGFDVEKKKEQRRQREVDFQEELRKIMEAEKLQQMELELMAKGAQEKLEGEFLAQQELISNLKKRVDKERSMIEEEQKKRKEEQEVRREKDKEDKRKREEEEKRKMKEKEEKRKNEEDDKRKRQEERKQINKEEKRKMEEMRLKEEDRRNKEEEQMKKKGEEQKRKREEEEHKLEEEKKKENEERKGKEIQMREEEERRNEEIKEKQKDKDEKKLIEETGKELMEDEKGGSKEKEERKKKDEEEVRITKEPDVTMKQEEKGKKVEERKSEEERRTSHAENKMTHDQMRRIEEGGEEKRMDKEKRHSVENKYMTGEEEEKKTKVDELEKKGEVERKRRDKEELRVTEELEMRTKQGMGKNEVEGRSEEDGRTTEGENKMLHELVRKEEEGGEEKGMVEEKRHGMENVYMREKEEQKKTKEEEQTEELEKEIKRQKEEECRNREEEIKLMQENEADNKETEDERNRKDQERQEETKIEKEDGTRSVKAYKKLNEGGVRENIETGERILKESDISKHDTEKKDNTSSTGRPLKPTLTSSGPAPSHSDSADCPSNSETLQQHDQTISQTPTYKTTDQPPALSPSTSCSSAACLSDHTEQKRLAWMKDCVPWSKLSLQNRRKQRACVQSRRGPRRVAEASSLPPLCTHTLLQSTGCTCLQELTTVTLEDLPGCSLSTLAQCPQLRSLTLRRCGLRSLEGISQLQELRYIDLQENEISYVECENMTGLRVLRLAHNKLTSIHGLSGADNLDVLDLSHNSITRIAGLESVRRLQRLSLHHNQLISTKGLRDVYTLLDLDCSHNHLARVEGLENSALLHTLDLRANSLSEPPSLNNQVLLRELHLDDNSISSLQDLSACWLPLLQHLSAAQNRITQLPSMSDFVSLENLDLRFNCLSEVRNVCDNLEGCQFLQEVQLTGNPLQQEHGWRATLQKALPGLSASDRQQTDSFLSPPAVQQVALASGSFLTLCQAQLQHTRDLQQHHSRELSNASSSLDAVMRHFTLTLKLAEEQRFAHEYGDTTVCDEHWATVQTQTETLEVDTIVADYPKIPPAILSRNKTRRSYWASEETAAAESCLDAFDGVKMGPEPSVSKLNSGSVLSFATKGKTTSFNPEKEPVSNQQDLHLKNTAAVVIQQHWRKCKQKFGNIHGPPVAEKGGERGGDGTPERGPSFINQSAVGQDYAATVIQAYWRGFSLRRRLASALAAVTWPDAGQDDTFEEVNVDEFIFDEAALEKGWTFSENSPPRHPASQQPLSLKPPGPCLDPSQYILPPLLAWSPMQAWVAGEHVDSAAQRTSPESSNRSKSPASTSAPGGLSERSEKILEEWGFTDSHTALLMLKRAQKMKPKKEQKKHRDPSIRLALFRNKQLQQSPVEARNRPARQMRNYVKVGEAGLGLRRGEETEQAQHWLHTQAAQSDRHSQSERFLPEINASILNGGRVQLVADPAYADHLHHASGSLANCSLAAQSYKVNSYTRGNSSGHARKEVPSPKRVTSAPVKKERISFRDNPVQQSGGWGGGKKRDRLYK